MSKLWLPEDMTEAEIDLVTNIEYAKFRIKLNRLRGNQMRSELSVIRAFVRQTRDVVSNLRRMGVRIVSLREYRKIQLELDKAESMLRRNEKALVEHESAREQLRVQITKMEVDLAKLKERGKVLEMKDYGKRKKR